LTRKTIALLVLSISLFGCTRFDRTYVPAEQKVLGLINKDQFKAKAFRKQYFDHTPAPKYDAQTMYEGKDQSYEEGFQAGCQTFASIIGTGLARMRDSTVDADKLNENPWYLRGYQDASAFCTHSLDWEIH
jgi:hypothetical protein